MANLGGIGKEIVHCFRPCFLSFQRLKFELFFLNLKFSMTTLKMVTYRHEIFCERQQSKCQTELGLIRLT